jgi:putative ribosome biogenesis GTPase RsgA
VTVGDKVQFIEAQEGAGVIVNVLPRRNKLARQTAVPMPSAHPFEQVIAANVDQVVPVFAAASPAPRWNLLDRYLISAESPVFHRSFASQSWIWQNRGTARWMRSSRRRWKRTAV